VEGDDENDIHYIDSEEGWPLHTNICYWRLDIGLLMERSGVGQLENELKEYQVRLRVN
jgi:hypothetical protein